MIRLLETFHRTRSEHALLGDARSVAAKSALFVLLLAAAAGISLPYLAREIRGWANAKPRVLVPASAWKALHGPEALSADPSLWSSPLTRAEPRHRELAREGRAFWIGATLPPALLREASASRANHLILGYINGTYRLYVDGELLTEGDYAKYEPLVVALPAPRLERDEPLRIALSITGHPGTAYPDHLNAPYGEGFADELTARRYKAFNHYWAVTEPTLLASVYLVLALLLFALWISAPTKPEHSYMALWLLTLAAQHALIISPVVRSLGSAHHYTLQFILTISGGALAFATALAFARARRNWFSTGIPVVLLSAVFLALAIRNPTARLFWTQKLSQFFIFPLMVLGALVCLTQASALGLVPARRAALRGRIQKLAVFGGLFFLLAAIRLVTSQGLASPGYSVVFRIAPLVIVFFLSLVVFADYRRHEKLLQESPATRYHLSGRTGVGIPTRLLHIDLKRSRSLSFELEARWRENPTLPSATGQSAYAHLTRAWYGELARLGSAHGAEILREEGDAILFSFDFTACRDPMDSIGAMLREIPDAQERLQASLGLESPLRIRGSVVGGDDLKAVWKPNGAKVRPAFEGDILVHSKRLLDLEDDFDEKRERDQILIDEALAREALASACLSGSFAPEPVQACADQEGKPRTFRILRLVAASAENRTERKTA